jgi:hypothetical protein
MPKVLKMIVAAAVFVTGLSSMGMVGLKDSLKRPEFCIYCHPDPYYTSWEDSDYLAATHARAAIPCQACHPRSVSTAMGNIVTQLKGSYRLRRLRVSKQACFQCHAHDSYAELIERTKHIGPDPSTIAEPASDGERSEVWFAAQNPHKERHYGEMNCRICHKMHRPSLDYCSECHEAATSLAGWTIQVRRKGPIPTPKGLPSTH